MITNEVYVEMEILRKHGFSLRQIAVEVGGAVNTVRRHLSAGEAPKYACRKKRVTKLSAYEGYLRERQAAARPLWIPATVLLREIAAQGYQGGISPLRAFLRGLRPARAEDPVVRFETAPGEQMQVDGVEFRKGADPLYAFCATRGYRRASHVEFVTDMKVATRIDCHQRAFAALGGVPRRVLYDNMKTVVLERDAQGPGEHRDHAGFLDYARHCGFVIKPCRPDRARTKGKVERFNGYLRTSFYVPLAARLKPSCVRLDAVTANAEVRNWLRDVANLRGHATTRVQPARRLEEERPHLQALPAPWRGDLRAARPQPDAPPTTRAMPTTPAERPVAVVERRAAPTPVQHPLAVDAQRLTALQGAEVAT